ncbi:MAG TPA: hypothetical protein VNJ53_14120 [Gaiellaceae bacterium]|nr:hypothetical protein [Gaiellaceae bacterium]
MTLELVLAALVAVLCVLAVALPFLREPEPESDRLLPLDGRERRRLELLEARDRALAALKELEFDHRTGAVSDEDYRTLVGPLRREAAAALRALEREEAPGAGAGAGQEPALAAATGAGPPRGRGDDGAGLAGAGEGRPAGGRT